MKMSWGDSLKIYWPFVVLFAVNVIGGIFAAGYRAGQFSILYAAKKSAEEAQHG